MGGLYSRPVCKRWCAVLLQAVGWLAQETCRKEAGRGDLRRVSSETPESRVPRCGLSPVGGGHRAQVFGVNASPDHSIWNLSEDLLPPDQDEDTFAPSRATFQRHFRDFQRLS